MEMESKEGDKARSKMRCSRDARRQPGLEKHKPVFCLLEGQSHYSCSAAASAEGEAHMSEMGNASQTEGRYLTAGEWQIRIGFQVGVKHPASYSLCSSISPTLDRKRSKICQGWKRKQQMGN